MQIARHDVISPNHGVLFIKERHSTHTFKIHVWRTDEGAIHFTFRHPDPGVGKRAQSIIDHLNRIIPFDVYDMGLVK